MSDYQGAWEKAKDEFEAATGLKKPAAKGKVLFISFRKPSGLEDAFKSVDKYDSQCLESERNFGAAFLQLTPDFFKKWDAALDHLEKKRNSYLPTLEKAIEDEKDESGKSERYRAFKTLKATLTATIEAARTQFVSKHSEWKLRKANADGQLTVVEGYLHFLGGVGQSLKSTSARGALFCKTMLQNPNPREFERAQQIGEASRDMSQCMNNLRRFVFTDFEKLFSSNNQQMIALLEDPRIAAQTRRMHVIISEYASDIERLCAETGDSFTDASLAKLANSNLQFPEEATADDVRAAVKHFAGIVKKCAEIGDKLVRFGN